MRKKKYKHTHTTVKGIITCLPLMKLNRTEQNKVHTHTRSLCQLSVFSLSLLLTLFLYLYVYICATKELRESRFSLLIITLVARSSRGALADDNNISPIFLFFIFFSCSESVRIRAGGELLLQVALFFPIFFKFFYSNIPRQTTYTTRGDTKKSTAHCRTVRAGCVYRTRLTLEFNNRQREREE